MSIFNKSWGSGKIPIGMKAKTSQLFQIKKHMYIILVKYSKYSFPCIFSLTRREMAIYFSRSKETVFEMKMNEKKDTLYFS